MNLKDKLSSNTVSCGSWITLGHSAIAEIMAKAGFDWLVVDLEHSTITIHEAEELIRVIELNGVCPLVRLSANDEVQIKRVMDAGAHGIIVPMVNSKEDAQNAVNATYYPPIGKRGVGLARAQGYGASFEKYKTWLENEAVVIVQIEHKDAVENIESILSVDSVDGFIVGPYDLSASFGVPGQFENPLFLEAMKKIGDVGFKSGKAPGIHIVEPDIDAFQLKIDQGYRFMAYSLDIRMIDVSCRAALDVLNG